MENNRSDDIAIGIIKAVIMIVFWPLTLLAFCIKCCCSVGIQIIQLFRTKIKNKT